VNDGDHRGSRLRRLLDRRGARFTLGAGTDGLGWMLAIVAASLLRFDFSFSAPDWGGVAAMVPVVVGAQVAAGWALGLYRGRSQVGSFDEMTALVTTTLSAAGLGFVVNLVVLDRAVPASVPLIAGTLALSFGAGARYVWRAVVERALRPSGDDVTRLLVFGAGDTGSQAVRVLLRNPRSLYLPVGFLDDDPAKRRFRVHGVTVLGTRSDLAKVAHATGAHAVLLAASAAPTEILRAVARDARDAGLAVRALPSLDELIDQGLSLSDIRPLVDAEVIGRDPVRTSVKDVRASIAGKRVLVTGAGGSIGAEICRQVAALDPGELIMLGHDESALHATQLSIVGHGQLDTPNLVVADIRERSRVDEVFAQWRPEVVFHAAGLKHVPLLEMHPVEAIKTNVAGTQFVLEAAGRWGAQRFVNISTDKAAKPANVLGYTKRIGERLTAWAARCDARPFVSVRFGNVLGTRGSVLTTFQHQIASGGPVIVTHPEVTRYFMTVGEAVQLVLQAAVIGRPGEVLVLDMGEPVSIRRLAEQLVAGASRPIEMTFSGLRRGEKLHEDLFGAGEVDDRPTHPLIAQVPVPPLDPRALGELVTAVPAGESVEALAHLCVRDNDDTTFPSRGNSDVGYAVVDAEGVILAVSDLTAMLVTGRMMPFQGLATSSICPDAAYRADASPMAPVEHPLRVTLATGRAVEDAVVGVRPSPAAPICWTRITARPVPRPDEPTASAAFLVLIRPIEWVPDPSRPEVAAELIRAQLRYPAAPVISA
jgi:FlaA1/EpsC-like NDP-sugar epimerase